MRVISLLAAFAFLAVLVISGVEGGKHRIVGGYPANENQFPYQVSIRKSGGHFCGGSIIAPTKILTAAHCFNRFGVDPTGITIKAGGLLSTYTVEPNQQIRTVSQIIKHSDWHPDRAPYWANDITILTLNSPLTYTAAVRAILLPSEGSEPTPGSWLVASGWGHEYQGGQVTDALKYTYLPVVDQKACEKKYGQEISQKHMCAGATGKDTCQGDSGGPLASTDGWYLIGLTSFGDGCGKPDTPGVYTKIAPHRQWILQNAGV